MLKVSFTFKRLSAEFDKTDFPSRPHFTGEPVPGGSTYIYIYIMVISCVILVHKCLFLNAKSLDHPYLFPCNLQMVGKSD